MVSSEWPPRVVTIRSIDAGDLTMARVLEGMALLSMKLQIANGWSWRTA